MLAEEAEPCTNAAVLGAATLRPTIPTTPPKRGDGKAAGVRREWQPSSKSAPRPPRKAPRVRLEKRPEPAPKEAPRVRTNRYSKSHLVGTDSDYLCLFCYDPLYINAGSTEEVCFNRDCILYANRGEFSGDIGTHEGPAHARALCTKSVQEFYKFKRGFLFRRLHEARAHECAKLLQNKDVSLGIIASLDHLLTRLSGNAAWGGSEDRSACRRAFDLYYTRFDILQLVESLCSKYYITTSSAEAYVIKYHNALQKFNKSLGILSAEGRQDRTGAYSFYHIDRKSRGRPAENVFDFRTMYNNAPTLISSLNHAFKTGHAISMIHRYPARSEDLIALLSVWKTYPPGRIGSVTEDRLREIYDGVAKKNGMRGDFGRFLKDYTSGQTYAPILVFDGEKYLYDYHSLFLYLLYLWSNNSMLAGTQTETGQAAYNKKRQTGARHFEELVRQKLRSDGFEAHPAPGRKQLRMSLENTHVEFDCIAVDRARKIIVLAEAKYEDISPSSKAGTTLVDQMVLDRRRGLLGHAKRHHRRRQLFVRHFHSMKERGLGLEGSFLDYTVRTLLVTKHDPLISLHKSVRIVSYEKFLSIDLRRGGGSAHA